jgi:predicted S18 family serine protease
MFDPQPILQKVNSMFIRDADGAVMTTGVQGETNEALKEAISSLNDYSKGKSIQWIDANKIKSMLQKSSNYKARRFDEANEAYKQAASLIKEGIDEQASALLSKHGGDVQNFQRLRGAYGKLSSLEDALNSQVGKDMVAPTFGETMWSGAKRALPYVAGAGVLAKGIDMGLGGR